MVFREPQSEPYQVRVLAPGFAAKTADVTPSVEVVTVELGLAQAAESVVVTATRTPVLTEAAGADVES